jgi:hypothetical protein
LWSWLIRPAVGSDEDEISVRATFDLPSGIVDEAVVISAQGGEVVEIGWPSVGPMDQVMGVDPAGALTAGETATLVPLSYLAVEPGRNSAGRSSDPDREPVRSIQYGLKTGVACKAADRLSGNGGSGFDFSDAGRTLRHVTARWRQTVPRPVCSRSRCFASHPLFLSAPGK